MKRFVPVIILSCLSVCPVFADASRPTMISNRVMSAPRYTASVNQLNSIGGIARNATIVASEPEPEPEIDMREAERNACINNNVGIGNTFVWASRYSDTSNYASMVEDTTNPQNNVCFVRVELKSDDESRVSVSDIEPKYFTWGDMIECGSWVDEKEMEKRILNARKGARIGGIVASTVGGAGLGVGAMELFGNRLIGGKVMGQKDEKNIKGETLNKAVLSTYCEKKDPKCDEIIGALKVIKQAHEEGAISDADYEEYRQYESLIEKYGK